MEARARRYHRWQLVIGVVRLGATGGVLAGAAWAMSRVVRPPAPVSLADLALVVAAEAALLGAAVGVVTAPLTLLGGYWLPRRFGLLHQSFRRWLRDRLKAAVIGSVLGLLAVDVLYLLLATTPRWWLIAAGVFVVATALLATVAPVWLVPLFYRLRPLEDAALRERLLALAGLAGVRPLGVWVVDRSAKSRTANAALTGIGPTRRIILFDTLLHQFTPDQVEAVLAHELGHHVHGDVWRGLLGQGALTLVAFWAADRLLQAGAAASGREGLADPAGLPWLVLVLGGVGLAATPLANAVSRWLERGADDFAVAITGNVAAFVGAMERLAALNLAERRPGRLRELLLYSHPSIDRRIDRALAWNARGFPDRQAAAWRRRPTAAGR